MKLLSLVIKRNNLFLLSLIILITVHCEKEKPEQRDYPQINTLPVSNITEEGATFNADIYSIGTEIILEYGFVWGRTSDPKLVDEKVVLPGYKASLGVYSAEIKSALQEGIEYTVKPYVSSENHVVYGKAVTFTSLGSLAPKIFHFEPDTVEWGDTMEIFGENFSMVPLNNKVCLNQTNCSVISSTDTTISVIVNGSLTDIKSKVSVELFGNLSVYNEEEVTLRMPSISKIYPLQAKWGDTITVTGKVMNTDFNSFSITTGGYTCNILEKNEDTLLFTVPHELISPLNEVSIKINNTTFIAPESLTLISPSVNYIYPMEARWGDTITIAGNNFGTDRNKFSVTLGGFSCKISDYSQDSVRIVVPLDLVAISNEISIKINNLTIIPPNSITLKPPFITGVYPNEGTWGSILLLKGKFHPARARNRVIVGGVESTIISNYRDSIRIKIAPRVNALKNPVRLISDPFINVLAPDTFRLFAPDITSITPNFGSTGSNIKIRGKYIYNPNGYYTLVYFGSEEAEQMIITDSVISCKVPSPLPNGQIDVTVRVGSISTIITNGFDIRNPIVDIVYPLVGSFGDLITIEGKNFFYNGYTTYVLFENRAVYEAEIVTVSENKIVAKVPNIQPGQYTICVSLGVTTECSSFIINVDSP